VNFGISLGPLRIGKLSNGCVTIGAGGRYIVPAAWASWEEKRLPPTTVQALPIPAPQTGHHNEILDGTKWLLLLSKSMTVPFCTSFYGK
jgi:hypothetical protein